MAERQYAGIDVSKGRLDVAVTPSGEKGQFGNQTEGIRELVAWLQERSVVQVVLEATGHLELDAALAVHQGGIVVSVVNPRQMRRFAEAMGRLEKSDGVDAEVIAAFAQRMTPAPTRLPDEQQSLQIALVARRRQLSELLVAEANRLQSCRTGKVRKNIETTIKFLRRQLKQLDMDIDTQVRRSPLWQADLELLQSVPGVGQVTASTLVADLPEMKELNKRKLAKLVGVAPLLCESGQSRGQRHVHGGRASVRAKLYMATVSATRCNAVISGYYARLLAKGNAKKVALVACMHKLLDILRSILLTRQPWREISPRPA